MNCALLCNGPSRIDFNADIKYNYIIGCNIPWTKVDATVIMDEEVFDKFLPQQFYCSRSAWIKVNTKTKDKLCGYLLGLIDTFPDFDSAGHAACRKLLEMKPSVIDIYGCDSWFVNDTDSYTHQYVDSRSSDMTKNISVWRSRWYDLMDSNKNVQFNFIRHST